MSKRLFEAGDFLVVVDGELEEETGLSERGLVMVAGLRPVPVDETDPYVTELMLLIARCCQEGHVDTEELFMVSAKHFMAVSKQRQEELNSILIKDAEDFSQQIDDTGV